jgi:hypothetical protein
MAGIGARKYAFSADGKSILVEASVPTTKADAGMKSYAQKDPKTKALTGVTKHISVLTDSGWSEDTGLRWNGYPVRARFSLSVDLDGARTRKPDEMSVEEYERKRATAPATPATSKPTNGATVAPSA